MNKRLRKSSSRQHLCYETLESRRVLNADFGFAGSQLTLSSFVDSNGAADNTIVIEEITSDSYTVTLVGGGVWDGTNSAEVSGDGTNVLTFTGDITSIVAVGDMDAGSFDIEFGNFDFDGFVVIGDLEDGENFRSVTQQAGTSFEHSGNLGISVDGAVNLNEAGNSFDFVLIGADDIALSSDENITLGDIETSGNFLLNVDGNVSQNSGSAIQATGVALNVNGTIELEEDNSIEVLAVNANNSVSINNIEDLRVGSLPVSLGSTPTPFTGITTSNDNVQLVTEGDLAFDQGVNLGVGNLIVVSRGENGVSQDRGSSIQATGLALTVDGATSLDGDNSIGVLAVNADDFVSINNADNLRVGSFTASMGGVVQTFSGITTSNDAVELVTEGNLTFEQDVNLGTGQLSVLSFSGDVSQTANATISASTLFTAVAGNTVLNAANDVLGIEIFNTNSIISGLTAIEGQAVSFNNASDLLVFDAGVAGDLLLTTGGNLTFLRTVELEMGNLFVEADGDVSQSMDATISAAGLGLRVDGNTLLNETNDVDAIAIDNRGSTAFNDTDNLMVDTVIAEAFMANRAGAPGSISSAETSINTTIASDDILLTAGGDLTFQHRVLLSSDLFVDATGNVSQADTATISAAGLGLQVDGSTELNAANAVDVIAINSIGNSSFTDVSDLNVGTVTVESFSTDLLMSDDNTIVTTTTDSVESSENGISTQGGNIELLVGGDLRLEQVSLRGMNDPMDEPMSEITVNTMNDLNRINELISNLIDTPTNDPTSELNLISDIIGELMNDPVDDPMDELTSNLMDDTMGVTLGNLTANAGGDITVGSIDAGDVSLTAGDDVRDTDSSDDLIISATNLSIVAEDAIDDGNADGVRIDTATDTLSVNLTNDGGVFINELDDITLSEVRSNGQLSVTADGNITSEDVRVTPAADVNDVRLVSTSGQVQIDTLLTGSSDVFLSAGDDVLSTTDATPITADELTVRASNFTAGEQDGIHLSTNVVSADLFVNNLPSADDTAEISIDETNGIVVNAAVNRAGSISITANGSLLAERLTSREVATGNAIELTANGMGSDVVTGRVVVFNQTAGISISADDDIRHFGNSAGSDIENLIVASSLELVAGNNNQDTNFNGISVVQSRVSTASASVTGGEEARIFLNNTGPLRATNLSLGTGDITLRNAGNLLVDRAAIDNANDTNRLLLSTTGNESDIRVGEILARGAEGVFLDSADDIFDSSFMDDLFVDADFIFARSNNASDDEFDGTFLSASSDEIFAPTPDGGQTSVRDRS